MSPTLRALQQQATTIVTRASGSEAWTTALARCCDPRIKAGVGTLRSARGIAGHKLSRGWTTCRLHSEFETKAQSVRGGKAPALHLKYAPTHGTAPIVNAAVLNFAYRVTSTHPYDAAPRRTTCTPHPLPCRTHTVPRVLIDTCSLSTAATCTRPYAYACPGSHGPKRVSNGSAPNSDSTSSARCSSASLGRASTSSTCAHALSIASKSSRSLSPW